jgi:hypothetical protein
MGRFWSTAPDRPAKNGEHRISGKPRFETFSIKSARLATHFQLEQSVGETQTRDAVASQLQDLRAQSFNREKT